MADQNYSAEIDSLKKDLGAVRKDLVKLTQSLTDDARDGVGKAAQSTRDGVNAASRATQEYGREGAAAVSRQVEAHPLTSILTAAGIGFVIGTLIRRP